MCNGGYGPNFEVFIHPTQAPTQPPSTTPGPTMATTTPAPAGQAVKQNISKPLLDLILHNYH